MVYSTARLMSSGQFCRHHRRRTAIFTIAVLFLCAISGIVLVGHTPIIARLAVVLAPLALAAALLAIPADEPRAHDNYWAEHHTRTYPLHAAVVAGDWDSVNHFLAVHKLWANAKNADGATPLHSAYSAAIVGELLAAGADVNAKNADGETPLYFSARYGHIAVVSVLIVEGANVNATISNGETPLHRAARYGHLSVVSTLIAAGADVNAATFNRETPLIFAAQNGHATIAATLIASGADVNVKGSGGWTPLHSAAHQGYLSVVSVLIVAGADVNAKANNGHAPLHRAAYNVAVVSALIATGANVNAKDNVDWTPLHYAPRYNGAVSLVAVVSALVAAGADVNAKNSDGETPLHRAVHYGAVSVVAIVSALIAAGANVNAKNASGETPLYFSSRWSSTSGRSIFAAAAPVLIAAGGHWGEACANAAIVNPAGPSPTCLCEFPNLGTPAECVAPGVESCRELTPPTVYDSAAGECGDPIYPCHDSAIRKADNSGCECPAETFAHGDPSGGEYRYGGRQYIPNTAICHADHAPISHNPGGWHSAISENNPTLVAHFISGHGQDPDGNNALHSAAQNGYESVAKTLIESGADIDRKNGAGDAPLHPAVRNERAKLITLLLQRGADADAKGDDGDTALHLAARRTDAAENVGLIAFLLGKGADPNTRNDSGWRPLDLAYHGGTPGDLTWQARRGIMAALIDGGATWSDECTSGAIPNPNYRPSSRIADCVCPLHLSERNSRGSCECPGHSHSQVNGRCLPKDSVQVAAEIMKMETELLRLRAVLASLNLQLSLAVEMPRETVEEIATRADGDGARDKAAAR